MEAIGIMITYTYNIYIYISYLEKSRHPSNWLLSLNDLKWTKTILNGRQKCSFLVDIVFDIFLRFAS